jgi:hypothetical protein
MRMNQILSVFAGGLLALPTMGQIAPQPPVEAEPLPQAPVPPPQRPMPAAPPRPVVAPPEPLPSFDPIVPATVDGRLWLRPEPTDLLALGHNPLITAHTLARLAPVLSQRRVAVQDILLANPDTTQQMVSEGFTKIDLSDPSTLDSARAVLTPLAQVGPLTNTLNSSGLLDQRARQLNQQISRAYQNEVTGAVRAESPAVEGEDPAQSVANATIGELLFEFTIGEPKFAYGLLAAHVFDDLDASIAAANLSPASAGLLREAAGDVAAQSAHIDRARAAQQALSVVTLSERVALLNHAATLRNEQQFTLPNDSVTFRDLTVQERTDALMDAYAGVPFNWQAFVAE